MHTSLAKTQHSTESGGGPDAGHNAQSKQSQRKSVDNQSLQSLLANGAIRAQLTVGASDDPMERQADNMAERALRGKSACDCGKPNCGGCSGSTNGTIQRKPATKTSSPKTSAPNNVVSRLGSGSALGSKQRSRFEPAFGADLASVRIHTGPAANDSASEIKAKAFTAGNNIAFADGQYRPDTNTGEQLLAHELSHVLQASPDIHRQDDEEEAEGPDLDSRIASFKSLVKSTATLRLRNNRTNLQLWHDLVATTLTDQALQLISLQESGGTRPFHDIQNERDPLIRELRATQAFGENRACTGCHIEKDLRGRDVNTPFGSSQWRSPNEVRAGVQRELPFSTTNLLMLEGRATEGAGTGTQTPQPGIYQPPSGTAEAQLFSMFPNPSQTDNALAALQPIIAALQSYQVLDASFSALGNASSPCALRNSVLTKITERRADYLELIGKIDSGDVGYEHFAPIIRDLLPVAEADVRDAIQKEMDDNAFWDLVEAIVVGVLSVIALILTIFPPTSAAGLLMLGALEVGLGVYAVSQAPEMINIGTAYSLGTGANDVFDVEQQAAGDAMILGGFVSFVGGLLSIGTGGLRIAGAIPRLGAVTAAETTALARTGSSSMVPGQAVQQGRFLVTLQQDGSMVATLIDRPELLIIVRGGKATLYQSMGPGGLRVLAEAQMPATAARGTVPGTALMLPESTAAGGSTALAFPPGNQPLALLPAVAASTRPANYIQASALIGQRAATATLPPGYIKYPVNGLWRIRRAVADDSLFQRLTVDEAGLIQITRSRSRADPSPFMNSQLAMASDPAHPAHFLVRAVQNADGTTSYEWNTMTRTTRSGRLQTGRYEGSEHAPIVQAGHQSAYSSGQPQSFMLEDAGFNISSGATIESLGAFSFKEAVNIQGLRMDVATALMYERLGLMQVPGGVRSLPRIPAPGAP